MFLFLRAVCCLCLCSLTLALLVYVLCIPRYGRWGVPMSYCVCVSVCLWRACVCVCVAGTWGAARALYECIRIIISCACMCVGRWSLAFGVRVRGGVPVS